MILRTGPSLVVLLISIFSDRALYAHILRTKLGIVEGVTEQAENGRFFHAYYGIPYAKPPVGNLRFEFPIEAGSWRGILNATEQPLPCSQVIRNTDQYDGREDCLFVHVYTPTNLQPGSNIPVIFYIYGGVFTYGSPLEALGPENLMSRDIIMVMVSFRIGVLGYLSTGDTSIPGNMALKDQMLAMKWTKDNIYEFGGDPQRITVQGHSSGAVCAHLHTLSPLSRNYFHQAIIMSGLGINPQSFWDRDNALGIARALAARVNCLADSTKLLKKCLQEKTAAELVVAAAKLQIWNVEPQAIFRPVIEDKKVVKAFLSDNPLQANYTSNSKPWLIGMTSGEAAGYVGCMYSLFHDNEGRMVTKLAEGYWSKIEEDYFHPDSSILNIDYKLLFPIIGFFKWTSKPNHVDFTAQILKTRFFGEENVSNETDITDIALVKMLNGIMHGYGLIDVLQKYRGVKYAYLFDYRYYGGYTTSLGGRNGRYLGVAHADEMPIFFTGRTETGLTEEDRQFGDEVITRWINFAHSGNPNIPFPINTSVLGVWDAVSSPRLEFLRIKNEGIMEKDYFVKEYNFYRMIPFLSKYL